MCDARARLCHINARYFECVHVCLCASSLLYTISYILYKFEDREDQRCFRTWREGGSRSIHPDQLWEFKCGVHKNLVGRLQPSGNQTLKKKSGGCKGERGMWIEGGEGVQMIMSW